MQRKRKAEMNINTEIYSGKKAKGKEKKIQAGRPEKWGKKENNIMRKHSEKKGRIRKRTNKAKRKKKKKWSIHLPKYFTEK